MTPDEWNLLEKTVLEKIVHQRACADHVRREWQEKDGKEAAMAEYNGAADMLESIVAQLAAMLGGMPPVGAESLGVTGVPHGIERGWFSWPLNFDPVWLRTCNGFEAKGE